MNASLIRPGLRKIVRHNARLQSMEAVVIVHDPPMALVGELLEEETRAVSRNVRRIEIPPREFDGQEPTSQAAEAMRDATVIFSAVSRSITHTAAMKAALDRGSRALLLTAHNERVLTSPALLETDFTEIIPLCRRLGESLRKGHRVTVRSSAGTDITFSIEKRPVNVLTGVPEPGHLAPVPTIEVNVVPVTGSAEGVIVADASVPYLGLGILREPIICTVQEGRVTEIAGGEQAQFLKAHWEAIGNPRVYNVAELGIGLNPNAALTGDMLIDEGVVGTIHWGIGTSLTLGGEISAPTHYDLLGWHPTIEVDGRCLMNRDCFPVGASGQPV